MAPTKSTLQQDTPQKTTRDAPQKSTTLPPPQPPVFGPLDVQQITRDMERRAELRRIANDPPHRHSKRDDSTDRDSRTSTRRDNEHTSDDDGDDASSEASLRILTDDDSASDIGLAAQIRTNVPPQEFKDGLPDIPSKRTNNTKATALSGTGYEEGPGPHLRVASPSVDRAELGIAGRNPPPSRTTKHINIPTKTAQPDCTKMMEDTTKKLKEERAQKNWKEMSHRRNLQLDSNQNKNDSLSEQSSTGIDDDGNGAFRRPRRTMRPPKRKKTSISSQPEANIETRNRFDPLTDKQQDKMDATEAQTSTTTVTNDQKKPQAKQPKVPPITINFSGNYLQLNAELKKHLTGPIKAIYRDNNIKYHFETTKDYNTALDFFRTHEINLFTHQLQSDRRLKVVMKGLPPTIQENEIKEELGTLGFTDCTVYQFKKRHPDTNQLIKEPIYCVTLPRDKSSDAIYDVRHILYTKVIIEDYESKDGPPQCKRCQTFFHTANYCSMPARCVRCGEHHQSRDCKKPRSDPPTCANCGEEGHPASWRGCSTFQAAIKQYHLQQDASKLRREEEAPTATTTLPSTSSKPAQNRLSEKRASLQLNQQSRPSYRDVFSKLRGIPTATQDQKPTTSGRASASTNTSSDSTPFSDIFKEIKDFCNNLRNSNIFTILKDTFTAFKEAQNTISKILALAGGAMSIFEEFNG